MLSMHTLEKSRWHCFD